MNQKKHQTPISQAATILRDARNVVALTGAGIGRPSGIPDFRSDSGLWSKDNPMEVASIATFRTNPQRFYDWLRPLLDLMLAAQPNPAHLALAHLEAVGKLQAVVTQNIDELHQRAGSRVVYELHGHSFSATCFRCGRTTPMEPLIETIRAGQTPCCACGGPFKPDIVLFGEALPERAFSLARDAMQSCDALIVAGTSLEVHPAASLPLIAVQNGTPLIIVNFTETYLDDYARVLVRDDVAVALPAMVEQAVGKQE